MKPYLETGSLNIVISFASGNNSLIISATTYGGSVTFGGKLLRHPLLSQRVEADPSPTVERKFEH